MGGRASPFTKGPKEWDSNEWVGQPESRNIGKDSVKLNLPAQAKPLPGSQPLLPGPATSTEIMAPPTPGGSDIPLSRVLPSYTQKANQAMNSQDIPPSERQRVKRYFHSLQK
ncbi:MAG: hypothetical protein HY318_00610 [Armatimonadetes bacterium]|nr:hypothetical protein [Armatimonadota bacterium]